VKFTQNVWFDRLLLFSSRGREGCRTNTHVYADESRWLL